MNSKKTLTPGQRQAMIARISDTMKTNPEFKKHVEAIITKKLSDNNNNQQ